MFQKYILSIYGSRRVCILDLTSESRHIYHILSRPWQSQLISHFENPTDRQVIWITGEEGNEGKTFFQKYILQTFGNGRVCLLDLTSESQHIYHILSKFPLTSIDIIFNVAKKCT